ncbi:hypothetical protein QJS04_geneDACA002321 [Acorus gramineus]|uniref:Uncharacterized protein n=1 Tax=Acorus gramineus TaxID=55184 RepID=A0AAV9A9B7_ACOGR|nr:hypothetical protein QJS04_geneDACA002321 [Acorus gramineus]
MGEPEKYSRFMNPCILHLNKLELELKCPSWYCLEKFNNTPLNASCVFCHSTTESQFSGSMIHYMNGNPIAADQANNSGVLHVHQKCVDWAPQVYFEGEIVKNLDAEISRASKIKCSVCGKKGAALGCFVKSCPKSFHVPCAVAIPECRWDCDEFLVLCPNHSSCRFPSETSKKVKQRAKNAWRASTDVTREWVICGSALSSAEKNLLDNFAMLCGATISKYWAPNITHLIASTDESGACDRTLKVLKAILNGKWILRFDWIKACMEAMQPVPEEPYEVTHDVHGCFDGPKNGRIRYTQKAPKIFSGMCFHFSSYFSPDFKYLEELTLAAGGTIVKVYCLDPPEGCNLTEVADVIQKRAEEAEVFGIKSGNQVIGHTWLLDSIAACKLQPVDC